MPKSNYLDNLINGTLPINPRSSYINRLWRDTTGREVSPMSSNIFTNLTNESNLILSGSDYLNGLNKTINNQLVTDMSSSIFGTITIDKRYLPISESTTRNKNRNTAGDSKYKLTIRNHPDYLPATITRTTNGIVKSIPVLFPKSFSRSIQAAFAKESPVGSSKPIVAYSYTNAEQIPMEFDVLSDYLPEGYDSVNSYVEDIISLLKPKITNSIIHEPTVMVQFADISFNGICESISISYDNLYDYKSFTHAIISCNFTKLD